MIDIVGYGTLIVVLPGNLIVKLLDVAYVPDLSCDLFSLMAKHRRGAGCRTCLLYTSPSPRDKRQSRMPSSA